MEAGHRQTETPLKEERGDPSDGKNEQAEVEGESEKRPRLVIKVDDQSLDDGSPCFLLFVSFASC